MALTQPLSAGEIDPWALAFQVVTKEVMNRFAPLSPTVKAICLAAALLGFAILSALMV